MTQGQSESKKNESGLETVSDGTRKWTKDDTDIYSVLSSWFDEIEEDFDLILIQEYFFMSLALLVETFCWSVEDVIINPSISWLGCPRDLKSGYRNQQPITVLTFSVITNTL